MMDPPELLYPFPTAQVEPYVEALGTPLAVRFLIRFGGAEVSLSRAPRGNSMAGELLNREQIQALWSRLGDKAIVPLASSWLARCLTAEGASNADIARRIRVTDATVRKWLKGINRHRPPQAEIEGRR